MILEGGANGAIINLLPQKNWNVNEPLVLAKILKIYENIKEEFNKTSERKVSLADLIILAGNLGVEQAAKANGLDIKVEFKAGRMDTTQEFTDISSFEVLEPIYDPFRNYLKHKFDVPAEKLMLDKAQLLGLTAPEMTVLIGGLRSININHSSSQNIGILTDKPGVLSNDFFINILDMNTVWEKINDNLFIGKDRKTGIEKWICSRVDLIYASNSQLRALSEIYASSDSKIKFITDFVSAWNKVINSDRFDLDI